MGIESFGIASVSVLTVIAYIVGMACKAWEKFPDKFIPVVCGFVGGILGVVAFETNMAHFPATDLLTSIAVGIVSGLAATGVNQAIKQLSQ